MILSRNWLNEFVPNISVNDIDDKDTRSPTWSWAA